MPRVARVDIADYPYHVINRAVMRLKIFGTDSDYHSFEKLLKAFSEECAMRILAYVVMPNHWHFLLYPRKDKDLGIFMHRLTNAHTRRMKAKTNTIGTGPLYQGRYKSFLIQKDAHLLTVMRYIERNPVRAKLVKKPEDWRWGSAWRRIHGSDEQKEILAPSPVPLPTDYVEWVRTAESKKDLELLRNSVHKGTPFGREGWVEKTIRRFNLGQTARNPGRPRKQ